MADEPMQTRPVILGVDPEYHDFRIQYQDPKGASSAPESADGPQATEAKAPARKGPAKKAAPKAAQKPLPVPADSADAAKGPRSTSEPSATNG